MARFFWRPMLPKGVSVERGVAKFPENAGLRHYLVGAHASVNPLNLSEKRVIW